MAKSVLAKMDAKKVGQVGKHIETMNKWFDKALGFAKAADEKKKVEEAEEAAARAKAGEEEAAAPKEKKPEVEVCWRATRRTQLGCVFNVLSYASLLAWRLCWP